MLGLGQMVASIAGATASASPAALSAAVNTVFNQIMTGTLPRTGDVRNWMNFWAPSVTSARISNGRNLYALANRIQWLLGNARPNEVQGALVVLAAMLWASDRGMGFASATAAPAATVALAPAAMRGIGSYTYA